MKRALLLKSITAAFMLAVLTNVSVYGQACIANAGDDVTICADGEAVEMNGSAENASSLLWYTLNGTGEFDDPLGTDEMEMCFAFPARHLNEWLDGLGETHKRGTRYPIQSYILYQPPLIPSMKTLENKLTTP
jgi:hypothetical protein